MLIDIELLPISFDNMPQEELLTELAEEKFIIERCRLNIIRIQGYIDNVIATEYPFIGRYQLLESYKIDINNERVIIEATEINVLDITKIILEHKIAISKNIPTQKPNFHQIRHEYLK